MFNALKGAAVVLLFFHHFLTFPEFYLPEFRNTELYFYKEYFRFSSNMCVAIFAFLTGYGNYFSCHKGTRYFLLKVKKTLISYWIFFILFFFCAILFVNYRIDCSQIMLELFGLSENSFNGNIMIFSWYMPFYLTVLLILSVDFSVRRYFKLIITDILFLIVMPVFLFSFLGSLTQTCLPIKKLFVDLMLWFPCVMLGNISAKYSLLQRFDDFLNTFYCKSRIIRFLVPCLFIAIIVYGMYRTPGIILFLHSSLFLPIIFNMSVCYVLFLIYAITKLFDLIKVEFVCCMLVECGSLSLYMWLIHGLFFNVFKNFTQPILFLPKYPILILIWALLICLALTKMISNLINKSKMIL